MRILEHYLNFLQERQWDEETENPDAFDVTPYKRLMVEPGLDNPALFQKLRQTLQPSLFGLYIKNAVGDYKGRPDMYNARAYRGLGLKDFEKKLSMLKRRVNQAKKKKPLFTPGKYSDTLKEPASDPTTGGVSTPAQSGALDVAPGDSGAGVGGK